MADAKQLALSYLDRGNEAFAAVAAASAGAALFNLDRLEEARTSFARAKALDASVFEVHVQFAQLLAALASGDK